MKTLRLVFPQWQGADIARWVPEVPSPADSARGYALGAQLLDFLAPKNLEHKTQTVPVSMEIAPDGLAAKAKAGCWTEKRFCFRRGRFCYP